MVTTERDELPEGTIADVQDSYKYLGIPFHHGVMERKKTYQWLEKAGLRDSTAGLKMQAGTVYSERHNQVASIIYRHICAEYGLEVPGSKWATPPQVIENEPAKILWDFQILTNQMVVAYQPNIMVVK